MICGVFIYDISQTHDPDGIYLNGNYRGVNGATNFNNEFQTDPEDPITDETTLQEIDTMIRDAVVAAVLANHSIALDPGDIRIIGFTA